MGTRKRRDPDQPLGRHDIATEFGWKHATVRQWLNRDAVSFPQPDGFIDTYPWWKRSTIEAWARETGRLERSRTRSSA